MGSQVNKWHSGVDVPIESEEVHVIETIRKGIREKFNRFISSRVNK